MAGRIPEKFIWGWLRLALGWMQMGFSTAAMISLIVDGLSERTWALFSVALLATIVSRLLYKGRKGPTLGD